MVTQRGYNVVDGDEGLVATKGDETMGVFFVDAPKFNVSMIEHVMKTLNDLAASSGIIVYRGSITPFARRVTSMEDSEVALELFHSDELQFNVTKHRYVPPHESVSPEEAIKIKKKYGTKLAVLLTTDPVARFYAFRKGDIIRVTRKCGIAYRIVK